ncbi:MAG: lipoprotein insertase outer membrane protein LolB [Pseudomonadota bacterium]|nr:lipoprotein insertase outer membrane protein LolB [Pseudomonadota bacterium]
MHRLCEAARQSLVRAATGGPALAVAALLGACAPVALERPSDPGAASAPQASFVATGRLSARHGGDALTANFRWRHVSQSDELELASPFGQTVALLTGDASNVRLQTADGRVSTASDWSALTAPGLGWPLPVDGLAFWIQGAPRPGSAFSAETGDDGRIALLRQDGWTIVYHAYTQAAASDWRPARMTASYSDVELRIAVDNRQ